MNKILRVFNYKIHADGISSDFAQVFVQTSNNLYKKCNFMEFELQLANDLHGVHKPSFGEGNLKTYKSCAGRKPSYKNKRNF
jgi:hypothetical protein